MPHLVLLGDSIFDNSPYTHGRPDVIAQVWGLLPTGWSATLLARDGATIDSISPQLGRIPFDATHLVLSVGGNDVLRYAGILQAPARSVSHALTQLAQLAHKFEENYREAVSRCRQTGLPLTICTIYNGNFPDPMYQGLVTTALTVFNDAILRTGFELGLNIIDLRLICSSTADYANPIEPSSSGGAKIAHAIVDLVTSPPVLAEGARVVVR